VRCDHRVSEGRAVDKETLTLFSKVAGWGGRPAAMRVRRILSAALVPGATVLDIGTGPGTIPLHLQRYCRETDFFGLDVTFAMLLKAQRHRRKLKLTTPFLAGDGEMLPIGDRCVDVVTSFFALHHMDRPERFLKEAQRVLKPEGRLLVIDFRRDMPGLFFRLMNFLWQTAFFFSSGRFGFRDSVCSAWSPQEVRQMIERHRLNRFRVHTNLMELWVVKQ
jgi:ubiquinone/menaquinone biosynthesis C-methylase UbiE